MFFIIKIIFDLYFKYKLRFKFDINKNIGIKSKILYLTNYYYIILILNLKKVIF